MAKSPKEICRIVREHTDAIKAELKDIKGDHRHREPMRNAAWAAGCRLNNWLLEDFGSLHQLLGLGPYCLTEECEHDLENTDDG